MDKVLDYELKGSELVSSSPAIRTIISKLRQVCSPILACVFRWRQLKTDGPLYLVSVRGGVKDHTDLLALDFERSWVTQTRET